jgi:hypothetical protein
MERLSRKYKDINEIEIGDVVTMNDSIIGAFGSSIVLYIDKDNPNYELAYLARPHIRVDNLLAGKNSQPWVSVEKYAVELDRILSNFEVYVNGPSGEKDNRAR